jgi:hypothetical protein
MVHRWLEALFGSRLVRERCLRLGHPFSGYSITPVARDVAMP